METTGRLAAVLALLLLLAPPGLSQNKAESDALLALRNATGLSWVTATAALAGAAWASGTKPCGSGGSGGIAWKGVTCNPSGQVTAVQLNGLGLAGTLPALGAQLPALTLLDLRDNNLTGTLPPSWGAALPALSLLQLQGNNISGPVPMPEWTSGFAKPASFEPWPANDGLCGPVMPLSPEIFAPGTGNTTTLSMVNTMRTGSNTTSLELTQRDLLRPGTSVTITNWLGNCAQPCNLDPNWQSSPPPLVAESGLAWPPLITTNAFDLGWVYNMSLFDIANLNPNVAASRPGDLLSLPCYPSNQSLVFDYFGGDMAFGHFAGGNQLPGPEGLAGAMAAAMVVGTVPVEDRALGTSESTSEFYVGSLGPGGQAVVEPVYWFVDLDATFTVTAVHITAGDGIQNASLYIGSDPTSVFGNKLVVSGLDIAADQLLTVPANGTQGRYVILYTGLLSEGSMSLRSVEVFTFESNTANNMPITASYLRNINRGGAGKILEALLDNNASSCVQLQPDSAQDPVSGEKNIAWAFVDLGYYGVIGSYAVAAGPATVPGTVARAYVTNTADESPSEASACGASGQPLSPSTWAVGDCNQTGRFVTFRFSTPSAEDIVDVCEMQTWLLNKPSSVPPPPSSTDAAAAAAAADGSSGSSGGLSGGAIAGIVVGALLGSALALLLAMYLVWRHRWLGQQRQVAALQDKDLDQHHSDRSDDVENGLAQEGSPKSLNGFAGKAEGLHAEAAGSVAAAVAAAAAKSTQAHARRRPSEWKLLGEFFKSMRGAHDSSLSHKSRQESAAYGPLVLPIAKGTADVDAQLAATDLTKLPLAVNEVKPSEIQLIELVGEGSFGEVWLAMYCGAFVAVKILAKVRSDNLTSSMQQQIAVRNLKKEAILMSKLRHPNVCLYLGACMDPPCLLFEYCAKSSLDRLLRAGLEKPQVAKKLSWGRLLSMALDTAKGMLYLHTRSPPIAHRDLKSANLLVDSQWRVKVADFSLSRAIETGSKMYQMTVMTTNPRWLPPEVLGGLPGQLPADVWAFGVVLWELMTFRLPFEELNTFQIIALVQKGGAAGLEVPPPDALPGGYLHCYSEYVQLMQACLAKEPEGRPQFETIVQQLGAILTAEIKQQQQQLVAAAGTPGT